MAYCGSSCGSNCGSKDIETEEREAKATQQKLESLSFSTENTVIQCSKCGEEEARKDCNGLCAACFRAYLYGKFKLAVTSNAMIAPTDKVLVAFSGGPASRVALQFVHEMQYKALKSWDVSNSQALPVFTVGVALIDRSFLSFNSSYEIEGEIQEIRSIVSSLSPPNKEIHFVPIEAICSSDLDNGKIKLKELLSMVNDVTGREDLLHHLLMLSLQKIALENGYTKIILGSSASAIARRVISATVKGQGYSLPADIQYVDTRWCIPVVQPVRDCLEQELVLLCHLDSLGIQQLSETECTSINSLVLSFIARIREENPSREHTIVRTAGKLKQFSFNKFSKKGYHDFLPSRLRPKFQNLEGDFESDLPEILCPVCASPLTELELQSMRETQNDSNIFIPSCCESCKFQILPEREESWENFLSLCPKSMVDRRSLRGEIEDYLLDDQNKDDT